MRHHLAAGLSYILEMGKMVGSIVHLFISVCVFKSNSCRQLVVRLVFLKSLLTTFSFALIHYMHSSDYL